VTSRTTGDAEAIRQLKETLKRHRGDAGAWTLLGGQLRARRGQINPKYRNRALFVRERSKPRGLDYKFIYDLEARPKDGRSGFSIDKLLDVAAAYGVTVESIGAALDGGDLIPAAGPVPAPAAGPPEAVKASGILNDAAIVAAKPYATAIMTRLRDLAAEGLMTPSGSDLFLDPSRPLPGLDGDRAARRWDAHDDMLDDERAWLIAALQADAETAAWPDMNVG